MTVYVDNARLPWRGKEWCHLVAESVEELHAFADRLGLRRAWFQSPKTYPHYDITTSVRERALRLGAEMGDKRTIFNCSRGMRMELRAATDSVDVVFRQDDVRPAEA